jgi:hypothetical protein
MPRRTSPSDADLIIDAADLDDVVVDKREIWRASNAKAGRRQRRYKQLLTRELVKQFRGGSPAGTEGDHPPETIE